MSTNGDNPPGQKPAIETDETRAAEALASVDLEKRYDKQVGESVVEVKAEVTPPVPPLAPLYAALAKAQGEFPEIPKNRTASIRMKSGGEFKFKYSDLSDLIGATRPALSKNGLAQFQHPSRDSKLCVTVIAHESGATLEGTYPIHPGGDGRMHPAQDWAISYAYARRYGLSAMLGIAAEETIEGGGGKTAGKNFEDPDRDGILSVRGAKNTQGASPADLARSYAVAIEDQIGEAKTQTGLEGVWNRNEKVIHRLQDSYVGDYENVLACYAEREAELKA